MQRDHHVVTTYTKCHGVWENDGLGVCRGLERSPVPMLTCCGMFAPHPDPVSVKGMESLVRLGERLTEPLQPLLRGSPKSVGHCKQSSSKVLS